MLTENLNTNTIIKKNNLETLYNLNLKEEEKINNQEKSISSITENTSQKII